MKSIKKEMSQIEQRLKRNRQGMCVRVWVCECVMVCVCVVSEGEGEDDLDQFMRNVRHQLDPSQKRELKQKLHSLKKVRLDY